jgi:multidrug efflux pump subunit AcrA (membrane-fusion protein)
MRILFSCWVLLLICTVSFMTQASELTTPIAAIAIHPERAATATVVSNNQATLSAQITAKVQSIPVGISQRVVAGELLLALDCTDYDLALQMARAELNVSQARLALAERQKQRTDQLLVKQLASQETADNAEVALIASRGEVELAYLGVRKAEIDVTMVPNRN